MSISEHHPAIQAAVRNGLRLDGKATDPALYAPVPDCSEAAFTRAVVDLARAQGWRVNLEVK